MNNQALPPHIQLATMTRDYVVSRAIHSVAQLKIADHLSDEPIPVQKLAQLTNTNADYLERIMNFLSNYDVFKKIDDGYVLTPISSPLKSTSADSIIDVWNMFDEVWWQAFSQMKEGVQTGETPFTLQHGLGFFEYMEANPDKKELFRKGMRCLAAFEDPVTIPSFNFGQFTHLVYLSSPSASLLNELSKQAPDLVVTEFNYEPLQLVTDEVFATLPTADAYLFKSTLHLFDDLSVEKILKHCHAHMPPSSKLIIAEQAILDNDQPHVNKTMDIVMMVLLGGKQRTIADWCRLIASAGFSLNATHPTPGIFTIMEFERI